MQKVGRKKAGLEISYCLTIDSAESLAREGRHPGWVQYRYRVVHYIDELLIILIIKVVKSFIINDLTQHRICPMVQEHFAGTSVTPHPTINDAGSSAMV